MDHQPSKPNEPSARKADGVAPAILAVAPTALELLNAFRRRWLLAIGLGCSLAVVAGVIAWFAAPPAKYTARAQLFVSAVPPRVLFNVQDLVDEGGSYQRRQLALMRTRLVLLAALRRDNVANTTPIREAKDPVDWLDKNIAADFAAGGEILRISLRGDDPGEIATIVNAVVDAYMSEIVDREKVERVKRLNSLKDLSQEATKDLDSLRKAMKIQAEPVGSTDAKSIELQRQHNIGRLDLHRRELIQVQGELKNIEVELSVLQAKATAIQEQALPEAEIEAYVAKDPNVLAYQKRIADIETDIAVNAARLSDPASDPYVISRRKLLEEEKANEKSYREKMRPRLIEQLLLTAKSNTQANVALQQERQTFKLAQERVLQELIKTLQMDTQEFQRTAINVDSLRREIDRTEAMTLSISDSVRKLEFEANAPPRVHVLEMAEPPRVRDGKSTWRMAGLAALAAFGAVVGGIAFLEFYTRRVASVDQVVSGLGMPLVGALPPLPTRGMRLLGRWEKDTEANWQNRLTESIDAARTMLLYRAKRDNLQVVMITSAVSGEGKTSVSCHLATSLARSGRKTLLVDCDLRRPAAHRLFGLPAEPGLSELLRGETSAEDVIQRTPIEDLDMIVAGVWDPKATRALAQGRLGGVFESLKKNYELIIVDSSPVLPVVDAILVGKHVDGVLFSVLRDVSRLPMVYAAHQRMAALGALMLGAIVNGTAEACYGYQYSYRGPR